MLKLRKFPELHNHRIFERKMLTDHYELYKRNTDTYNGLVGAVPTADFAKANPNYSVAREVYLEQLFNHNASVLHTLYFENILGHGDASGNLEVISALQSKFQEWEEHLVSDALATRGWAILGWCPFVGDFHISMLDNHSIAPVGVHPLIVIDCYEHAYMPQYHLDRKKYISDVLDSLDWKVVNERYKHVAR